jgi:small subunit ribosomal protein S3
MGQKIHPVGMRLGITRTWDSRWFEKKHYIDWLHEDVAVRKFFNKWMRSAAISKIEIERRANQARVIVNTAKPGIIIGKRGIGIEEIRKNLEKLTGKNVAVNVMEIKHPELDARLVGQNIVDQLEKRIAFRRAMKQAIMRTMKAGARGVKVQVSGRLGGAEIARTERNADGKVPLHTLRADIDYANVEAFTTFGRIGVKVWIYRGEVLPDQARGDGNLRDRADRGGFRERRERGGRGRGRDARPPQTVVTHTETTQLPDHAPPIVMPEHASEAQALTQAALPNEGAPEESVDALVAAAQTPVVPAEASVVPAEASVVPAEASVVPAETSALLADAPVAPSETPAVIDTAGGELEVERASDPAAEIVFPQGEVVE